VLLSLGGSAEMKASTATTLVVLALPLAALVALGGTNGCSAETAATDSGIEILPVDACPVDQPSGACDALGKMCVVPCSCAGSRSGGYEAYCEPITELWTGTTYVCCRDR
jgi:hypothetical protein